MIRIAAAIVFLAAARPAAAQQFDPGPLLASATLDTAEAEAARQSFLRWARETPNPRADERVAAREQAYFLIGSAVKQNLFAQRGLRPPFDLANLAQLYEHAARLGAFGAAQVARALPLRESDVIGQAPAVPAPLRVEFARPFLRVSSTRGGWTAEVPSYFMIGELQVFDAGGGAPTEAAAFSTLFARNDKRPGSSQSTILLVASGSEGADAFVAEWLQRLGLTAKSRVADTVRPGAVTYRGYDADADMNKEVVVLRTARGPVLVAYVGLTGPFASNRANFLDFLTHLRLP